MHNESEWLRLIFLLADTQQWVDQLTKEALAGIPVANKKIFRQRSYYLPVTALAHILERHYYKIPRHPHAAKFTIPVEAILQLIKEGISSTPVPISGQMTVVRVMPCTQQVGINKDGTPAFHISIITDTGGKIITAFPGNHHGSTELSRNK